MNAEGYLVILAIIIMVIALIRDAMRPGLVIFSVAVALMWLEIISPEEMVSGFSNIGMLTIAVLYLVSEGVRYSGLINKFSSILLPKKRLPIQWLLSIIILPTAFISSFLNNTPVVIIFAPIVKRWAEKMRMSPDLFLLPLSYATIFGGICTLIGTSTNLVIHGMMIDNGFNGLGIFELGKVGFFIAIAGWLYLTFVGHFLLPKKQRLHKSITDTKEYYFNLTVIEGSRYVGETVKNGRLKDNREITIVAIERHDKVINVRKGQITLELGDTLLLYGHDENLRELLNLNGLKLNTHGDLDEALKSDDLHRIEVVLAPRFPGIGNTLEEFDFYNRYKGIVLAIHRNGENIISNLNSEKLKPGDSLIILADSDFVETWGESKIFFLISSKGEFEKPVKTYKIGWTISIVMFMVFGATFSKYLPRFNGVQLDMFYFASLAAVAMAVLRIFPPKKYARAIGWDVLITIASAFAISKALVNSGVSDYIAKVTIGAVQEYGPLAVLAVIYLITMVFTELITNSAAAALSFPIALSAAMQLGVDPKPFFIAICIAASASFSTPIGYQTNLIIQAIGNYKFRDYLKVGVPLNIIAFILSMIIIPLFWKF